MLYKNVEQNESLWNVFERESKVGEATEECEVISVLIPTEFELIVRLQLFVLGASIFRLFLFFVLVLRRRRDEKKKEVKLITQNQFKSFCRKKIKEPEMIVNAND